MKYSLLLLCFLIPFLSANSQHYYKDLLMARQLMEKDSLYRAAGVASVQFSSYDANNQPIEGFTGGQTVSADYTRIETDITDPLNGSSQNTAIFSPAGRLLQTIDTSDGYHNTVSYSYDDQGRISRILSASVSAGGFELKELHIWTYNSQGVPVQMVKIKNDSDTTIVHFTLDEQGDPGEEKSVHQGIAQPAYYYYFDQQHRLTDVVRYNVRARRLLPDYVFEYEKNRLSTMLVVSEGSTDYQKWYYSYDEEGLKGQDACYSKTQVLIGRVEYKYQYRK